MPDQGVFVQGLNEITKGFLNAGVELEELKDVMGGIAQEATNVMQPFIPHRSGALRASARPSRAKNRAIVTIGKAKVPYAAPIQYGWAKRNIEPARFVEKTDEIMETRVVEMLEKGWEEIAIRNGLL